ncbi:lipopolysaccharide biosynthesis protein [Desulfocapsa sulfexigens]|nr:lipopolysaccharide biosynthesis protein [Desulfocapsa sulfexigens]
MSPADNKSPQQVLSFRTIIFRSLALIGSKSVQDALLSLLFIWLARIDQSGYGLIVLGLSIVTLLRSLQSMGLDQYTLRELSASKSGTGPLLRQMALMKVLISGGSIFIFLTFALFIKQWPLQQITIISILLLSQCFEGMADTFFNLFRAEGKNINEGICRTVPNIIAFSYGAVCLFLHLDILFFSLLFLLSGGLKLSTAIFGARRLCYFSLKKNTEFPFKKNELISLALISGVSFLGTFYNEIQIFWIRQYHTFNDVAIYKVASDITGSICGAIAHLVIGAVLFPQLVSAFSDKNKEHFREVIRSFFKKIVLLGSGLAVLLAVFGGKIAFIIYGENYSVSEALVPFFGAAAFFSFINNFIIYSLLAMRLEKQLLIFLTIPVLCSIVLGPLLIADTGPLGGVLSLLGSRIILSIILIATLQKRIRFFDVADYKNTSLYWLGTIVLFILFLPVNYYVSGTLALSVYFLLVWREQRSDAQTNEP